MTLSPVPLIVILGPTATGKSDLALELCEALDGEVVSADSVQVYRGFDIGTGKLRPDERRGIPHHLLDILDPHESFSAARFVAEADAAIEAITARGRTVVVAGGTGLYLRALLRGLFAAPPSDEAIRERHREAARSGRLPELYAELGRVDPVAAARIHANDLVRISRALEVFELSGRPISELQVLHREAAQPRYPALCIGLRPPRAHHWPRIEARVHRMMREGWLDEVQALITAGYGDTGPMASLGYRQLAAHLRGELDRTEAVRQTVRDTRRFARRQLAWFASEPDVTWVEQAAEVEAAWVRGWLDSHRRSGVEHAPGRAGV